MSKLKFSLAIFLLTLVSNPAKADNERRISIGDCIEALSAPTQQDLVDIADTNCMRAFGDTNSVAQGIAYLHNTKCIPRRFNGIGRRARKLYEAAIDGEDISVIEERARDLRHQYRGRSSMYRRCWRGKRAALRNDYYISFTWLTG